MSQKSASGRSVLVTGGAAGIGAGVARLFAESGYAVGVFDLDGVAAARIAKELSTSGPSLAVQGDVSIEADVARCVEELAVTFGGISVLINNAGIEVNGSISELSLKQWDRQLAVNLSGTFLLSKYVVERMRGTGGAIINISSVHAYVSWPGCPAYDTTKAGLIGLTRAMALDHASEGIRVNAICPGYIQTPLMDRWLATLPDPGQTLKSLQSLHPVGRIGTPKDIAHAALFLASDQASFITGCALTVDGGMTIVGH